MTRQLTLLITPLILAAATVGWAGEPAAAPAEPSAAEAQLMLEEAERVRMVNMSAAMASAFVTAAQEMTGLITSLGPNPLRASLPSISDSERGE